MAWKPERILAIYSGISDYTLCVPTRSGIKRFAVVGSRKVTKQARVEATVLNALIPISKADICKILPDVSANTFEAVLVQMVRNGQIRKVGTGCGTRCVRTGI